MSLISFYYKLKTGRITSENFDFFIQKWVASVGTSKRRVTNPSISIREEAPSNIFRNFHLTDFVLGRISIETITWHRDTNGLFDFEFKNVTRQNFSIVQSGKFIRKSLNEIEFLNEPFKKEIGDLAYLSYKEGHVLLTQAFSSEEEQARFTQEPDFIGANSIWNVVNQYKQAVNPFLSSF